MLSQEQRSKTAARNRTIPCISHQKSQQSRCSPAWSIEGKWRRGIAIARVLPANTTPSSSSRFRVLWRETTVQNQWLFHSWRPSHAWGEVQWLYLCQRCLVAAGAAQGCNGQGEARAGTQLQHCRSNSASYNKALRGKALCLDCVHLRGVSPQLPV